MKRIRWLCLLLLLFTFVVVIVVSCKKKETEEKGCITGTVTFFNTGSVTDAYVQLLLMEKDEVVYSSVINESGHYTIDNITPGSYRFKVYKKGFVDTVFAETVQILSSEKNQGECWSMAWTIMKLPPKLCIVDNEGQTIDSLNYGSAVDDIARSFNIFNDASQTLRWEITKTAAWISSVSRDSGELRPGGTQAVIVTIDREGLKGGMNETTLHITSDAGSKELKVTAIGERRDYPLLNTLAVTDIKTTSAIFHGVLMEKGLPAYTERGFVYGLSSMPTMENTIDKLAVAVTEDSLFQATVVDLEEAKTYYVRAYAVNKKGIAYSTNEERFQPQKTKPTVTTGEVFDKNLTNRRVAVSATITEAGDPVYTKRGFVYGTSRNPMLEDAMVKEVRGNGVGGYVANLTDLEIGKTYYVRAYVEHETGVLYGSEVEFCFEAVPPLVETLSATDKNIDNKTITLRGEIKRLGSPTYREKGFVYGLSRNPMLADEAVYKKVVSGCDSGSYLTNIADLDIGEIYYVRAYAENEAGVVYGSEVELDFRPVAPQIETHAIVDKSLSNGTATLQASIVETGTPAYREKGFVYGLSRNPMLEDEAAHKKVVFGGGNGFYSANIAELAIGEIYYVRAYAENEAGVVYGSEEELDFRPVIPRIEEQPVSNKNLVKGTVTLNASVIDMGDPVYKEKGFVYGLSRNPMLEDETILKKTVVGHELGYYSGNITELEMGKIYYARAYAENEAGVAYGPEMELDFNAVEPEIITKVSDVTANTVIFHSLIQSVGDPVYTESGFIYGAMPNPTIQDGTAVKESVTGVGIGEYVKKINGLQEGETYYVRAYARNEYYTTYGNVVSFNAVTPEYIILPEIGLMVQKSDLGLGDWTSATLMSETSLVGGFYDWRLPTAEELMAIYNKKAEIGGFMDVEYWSSETFKENYRPYYVYIDFRNGIAYKTDMIQLSFGIRAVRTIKEE